jgi:hypothetical protein
MVNGADLKPAEQCMDVLGIRPVAKLAIDHFDFAEPAKEEEQVALSNPLIREVGLGRPLAGLISTGVLSGMPQTSTLKLTFNLDVKN